MLSSHRALVQFRVQHGAVQCNAARRNAAQCSAMQRSAARRGTGQHSSAGTDGRTLIGYLEQIVAIRASRQGGASHPLVTGYGFTISLLGM